jgi:3-deoxy-7-phosphoheptulonate synthase
MLEVHPDPENSAVDPLQPIDFNSFTKLMQSMDKVAHINGKHILNV